MGLFSSIKENTGWKDLVLPGSTFLGNKLSGTMDRPTTMETDPYSQWLTQQVQGYTAGLQNSEGGFSDTPTFDSESPFGRAMIQALQGRTVNPEDWGMMQGQDVEDYYKSTMYDPAVRQYENVTRPAWMENVGNLHSSYRDDMEQRGYENLYGGLEQQRGNLQYQNLLRNQQMRQAASGMNLQAQQGAMGMYGQYDPEQIYLSMLKGQTPTSTVVQQPSGWDMLSTLLGGSGAAMQGGAAIAAL